jgi:antidote-toxin recognition MazE-like antitoxin
MTDPINRRVTRHRQKLRAAGLRPVQLWVPDTRRKGFAREAVRQSLLLKGDALEGRTLRRIAAAADAEGWA